MDKSGDAKVDEFEFTCFMLRAMRKADEELLEEIDRQFNALDADGSGKLDWKDIQAGAAGAAAEAEDGAGEATPLTSARG